MHKSVCPIGSRLRISKNYISFLSTCGAHSLGQNNMVQKACVQIAILDRQLKFYLVAEVQLMYAGTEVSG